MLFWRRRLGQGSASGYQGARRPARATAARKITRAMSLACTSHSVSKARAQRIGLAALVAAVARIATVCAVVAEAPFMDAVCGPAPVRTLVIVPYGGVNTSIAFVLSQPLAIAPARIHVRRRGRSFRKSPDREVLSGATKTWRSI